jgi:hypothetical protein
MPTLEDLKIDNANSLSQQRATRSRRSTSRAAKDKMNDALRNATSTSEKREIKEAFKVDTNKASSQTDNQQGVNEDSNQRGDDDFKPTYNEDSLGGSGDGLPEYPSDIPDVPDFKGILAWSVAEGSALWLQGTPVSPSEEIPYVDVMVYDPTSTVDNFSLQRTEFLSGIICKNGAPINGKIFFVED